MPRLGSAERDPAAVRLDQGVGRSRDGDAPRIAGAVVAVDGAGRGVDEHHRCSGHPGYDVARDGWFRLCRGLDADLAAVEVVVLDGNDGSRSDDDADDV